MKKRFLLSLNFIIALIYLTASLAHAQGLTIGIGSTLDIGNGNLTVPNDIAINGTLAATAGTINVGGSWTNNGTFTAGTGTLNFIDGQSPIAISGNSQFYNLNATTSVGKQLNFGAGGTQTITNSLNFQGASGNLLVLRSTAAGVQTMIDLQAGGAQTIGYVDVMDHYATGQNLAPGPPLAFNSVDSGNNTRWFENYIPPTLSYSSEAGYGTDGIDPDSGTGSTEFTYKVVYIDGDNQAPASIKVHIDSDATGSPMSLDTSATLTLRDGDYTNGEQYYYISTHLAGPHDYYFDTSDGINTARLPSSGALSGPSVSNLIITTESLPDGLVGEAYSKTLAASGGVSPYDWSITSGQLPAGLSLNSLTGKISGTPTMQGNYGFTASVTDVNLNIYSKLLSVTIPNRAPVLNPIGNQTLEEGGILNILVTANDPDGDSLILTATDLPLFCSFTDNGNNTGSMACSPGIVDAGTYPITFEASDSELTDSEVVEVLVFVENPVSDAPSGDQRFPWVDYNETTAEYLAIWQDKRSGAFDDIYGVLLDVNGNPIGSDFAISTAAGHQQRVLVKAGGGGYLALWHDLRDQATQGADIYGAWVAGDGTVGPEMAICSCPSDQWNAVAGYDPVSNSFLVVWLDGRGSVNNQGSNPNDNYDLYGVVIPAGGSQSLTPFTVVSADNGQRGPQIGYDYGNGQYYMAWNDRRSGTDHDIYGARLTTAGVSLDGSGVLLNSAGGNQFRPTVTDRRPAAGISNHLIAWTDYRNGAQGDIYGLYVDGSGAIVSPGEFAISTDSADEANVVADVDWINTKKNVLSWIRRQVPAAYYNLVTGVVDQAGGVAGGSVLNPVADEQRASVVTYATDGLTDFGFLAVSADERNGIDYDIWGIKLWP